MRALLAVSFALAVGGTALGAGVAAGRFDDPFVPGLGAGLALIVAVGVILGPVRDGSGEAPCPGCGARIIDLERRGRVEGILCGGCGSFLRCEDGRLGLVDPAAVDDEPHFGARLPERFHWPPGCVVCGDEVKQMLPLRPIDEGEALLVSAAASLLVSPVGLALAYRPGASLHVPHCTSHDDGARLARGATRIVFRSYPYQRAFCELNGTPPVEHRSLQG